MRLLRLRGRLGPFRNGFDVDFRKVPEGLVAIVGKNGSGKTMLVESYPAAFYREMPSHGSLADVATSRDSYVEATIETDQVLVIRQTMDSVSGKGEAFIAVTSPDGGAGAAVLSTSKVSEADRWVDEHLQPREVFFSSLFAPQQSGGFLDLTEGERKAIILRVLGLERYEAMAKQARADAETAEGTIARRAPLLADAENRGSPLVISRLKDLVAVQEQAVKSYEQDLTRAKEVLETRKVEHAAALSAAREGEAAVRRHRDAKARFETALKDVVVLGEKVAAQEKVLADRGRIEAAVKELEVLDADLKARREEETAARAEERSLEGEFAIHLKAGEGRCDHETRIRTRIAAVKERLRDAEKIRRAVLDLPGSHAAVADRDGEDTAAGEEVERLQGLRVGGVEDRVVGLRTGLDWISGAGTLDRAQGRARETLDADNAAAKAAVEVPEALAKARLAAATAQANLAAARRVFEEADRLSSRLPQIQQAQVELRGAESELACVEKDIDQGAVTLKEAAAKRDAARAHAANLLAACGALSAKRPPIAYLAAQRPALLAADARLEELRPALERVRLEKTAAGEALRLAPDPNYFGQPVLDVAKEERAIAAAESLLAGARDVRSARATELVAAEASAVKLVELQAERTALEEDLFECNRLAEDLGRKGLQALEIDAAGPELTVIVNDLLREAFGPRYTITLETTRPRDKDGEPIEVFNIRAMDCVRGWEGDAKSLSGGQKTIVGEALRLALTTLAARKTGVRECTLVRDESGAALDQENGPAWIAMLRRAAALVGAKQVLFVSHDPALWALADSRIRVTETGSVEVEV